jgi:tetratricopeptide (TPR) repeat protein
MTAPKGFRNSAYLVSGNPASANPNPEDSFQSALILHSQGRFEEALEHLPIPGDCPAGVHTLRGDLLVELGRWAEAVGSYSAATSQEPEDSHARRRLASSLHRLGRWEQAAEAYQIVLRSDPHGDPVRLELADCLLHLNRPDDALRCFEQCWSDAAQRQVLFGKGVALQLLRRFEEAAVLYEQVLELDPKAEEVLANLVALSLDAFDLERVQRYSGRLMELNPYSAIGLQGLTLVALERGEMDAAGRHFSALLAQLPETVRPARDESDDEVMEYRMSQKAMKRVRAFMRPQVLHAASGRS